MNEIDRTEMNDIQRELIIYQTRVRDEQIELASILDKLWKRSQELWMKNDEKLNGQ